VWERLLPCRLLPLRVAGRRSVLKVLRRSPNGRLLRSPPRRFPGREPWELLGNLMRGLVRFPAVPSESKRPKSLVIPVFAGAGTGFESR
jgi:hypothetical protein